MITPWDIIAIQELDNVGNAFAAICLFLGLYIIGLGLYLIVSFDLSADEILKIKGRLKKIFIVLLSFGVITAIIPSSNDVYKAIAIPVIVNSGEKAVNSQAVNDSVKLVQQYLTEKLNEGSGK